MSVKIEDVLDRILSILKGKNYTVYMYDGVGARTYDYKEAVSFFASPINMMIIVDEEKIKVSIGTNFSLKNPKNQQLLRTIKATSKFFNIGYSIRKYGNDLSPKDFSTLTESDLRGSARSSYQNFGNIRMIVKHTGKIDENLKNARKKNIKAVFIQDSIGQRFKSPTTWLEANEAICRIMQEGFEFHSDTVRKVYNVCSQYDNLRNVRSYLKNACLEESQSSLSNKLFEKINEIENVIEGINKASKTRYYLNRLLSINNVKMEDFDSRLQKLSEQLNITSEDLKMKKMLETVVDFDLDKEDVIEEDSERKLSPLQADKAHSELKSKEKENFIMNWAHILSQMYSYTAGEEARHVNTTHVAAIDDQPELADFRDQAERLALGQLKADASIRKASEDFDKNNKELMLASYYTSVSNSLSSEDDILGNIIARLGDYYYLLGHGKKSNFSSKTSDLQKVVTLADKIGSMIGLSKPVLQAQESASPKEAVNKMGNWFESFGFSNIIKDQLKEKKLLESYEEQMQQTRLSTVNNARRYFLIPGLDRKVNSIFKMVESLQDKTAKDKLTKLVSYIVPTNESAMVSTDASKKFAFAAQKSGLDLNSLDVSGKNVLKDCMKLNKLIHNTTTESVEQMVLNCANNYNNSDKIQQITKSLSEEQKKNLLALVSETWNNKVVKGLAESLKIDINVLKEAKNERKGLAAFGSAERMSDRLDSHGSPREIALDKALLFVNKGIYADEALQRVGLPANQINRDALNARVAQTSGHDPNDKYAAMAKKAGVSDREAFRPTSVKTPKFHLTTMRGSARR